MVLKSCKFWHHLIPKFLTDTLGSVIIKMNNANEKKRIESKLEVQTYIDRLKYAIEGGSATINFQKERQVDKNRNREHTNRYTMSKNFIFVMSFHFSEMDFNESDFPYR